MKIYENESLEFAAQCVQNNVTGYTIVQLFWYGIFSKPRDLQALLPFKTFMVSINSIFSTGDEFDILSLEKGSDQSIVKL